MDSVAVDSAAEADWEAGDWEAVADLVAEDSVVVVD